MNLETDYGTLKLCVYILFYIYIQISNIWFRPNSKTFAVDSVHYKKFELKQGDVVTFEYINVTKNGKPVNPIITKIRTDINWKTVVTDFLHNEHGIIYKVAIMHLFFVYSWAEQDRELDTSTQRTCETNFGRYGKKTEFESLKYWNMVHIGHN